MNKVLVMLAALSDNYHGGQKNEGRRIYRRGDARWPSFYT
jgi:hypothetical protein